MTDMKDLRWHSNVYDGPVKSPNRAMLRATGMEDDNFNKPIVGVISTFFENVPGNIHLRDLAQIAKIGRFAIICLKSFSLIYEYLITNILDKLFGPFVL